MCADMCNYEKTVAYVVMVLFCFVPANLFVVDFVALNKVQMVKSDIKAVVKEPILQVKQKKNVYPMPLAMSDWISISSPYGVRSINHPSNRIGGSSLENSLHGGVDFTGTFRAQVIAVANGVVLDHYLPPGMQNEIMYAGHPIYGGYISIKHDDGYVSGYAHLSRTYVREGTRIFAGDVIGRIGNTGRSYGEHLHFSLHDSEGNSINPLQFLM